MKRFFLLSAAAFLSVASHVQVKNTNSFDWGWPSRNALSIPKEFAFGNTPLLTLYDDSEEQNLLIYDENIELIKTIHPQQQRTFDYQLTYQDEEREISAVNIANEYEEYLGMSYEEWLQQQMTYDPRFTESQLTITQETDGDSLIVMDLSQSPYFPAEQSYFNYDYFGKKYPKRYWRCKSGQMYLYQTTYKVVYTDWHVTGTRVENKQETLSRLLLCNINLNEGDGRANYYFEASQTLFNEDEEFEYIIPKYVLSTEGYGGNNYITPDNPYSDETIITQRSTIISGKSKLALAGFQVVSADGNVVKTLDFDRAFAASTDYIYVITIGSKIYLAFNGSIDGEACTLFYLVEKSTSDIRKAQAIPARMLVSPTVADKNAVIHITLTDDNAAGSEIVVVSSSGAQTKRLTIPAGQKEAQISADGVAGVYNIARLQKNKVRATQKIIIK